MMALTILLPWLCPIESFVQADYTVYLVMHPLHSVKLMSVLCCVVMKLCITSVTNRLKHCVDFLYGPLTTVLSIYN